MPRGIGRVETRSGQVCVWVPGTAPTLVRVTLRAPARTDFTSYRATKTYTTATG